MTTTNNTANMNKKFNELIKNEMSKFFDFVFENVEDEIIITKENLMSKYDEFFVVVSTKKEKTVKAPREKKEIPDNERCQETKKDGSRCNGTKTKKEEHIGTDYENMCSLHINSAKKAKTLEPVEEQQPESEPVEEQQPETEPVEKTKKQKKTSKKTEIILDDEL
jgi:hypothetical protein